MVDIFNENKAALLQKNDDKWIGEMLCADMKMINGRNFDIIAAFNVLPHVDDLHIGYWLQKLKAMLIGDTTKYYSIPSPLKYTSTPSNGSIDHS